VILLDPGGEPLRQARARDLAVREHLVLICPRYEGVDDRVRGMVDLELSIGDYVLSGGEVAAMVVVDAVLRLLPGAIDEASPSRSRSPRQDSWSTRSGRARPSSRVRACRRSW
jgi:tRNA (guanine37-N1)-methyltransferase